METITLAPRPASTWLDNAVVLLFAAGERPSAREIQALSRKAGQFAVTLESTNPDEPDQWVELLANGLTFDMSGLAPGQPCKAPEMTQLFGFDGPIDVVALEGVALSPGPHLTSGGPMVPVLRCLAWLAAELTQLSQLRAIAWQPAGSISSPAYFNESVMRWIGGGAFPGLGLTTITETEDGGLISHGLALFTGQELKLEPSLARNKSQGAKVALRLLHWLVENGSIDQTMSLTGPAGDTLVLEPQPEEGIVIVWSGSR